MLRKQLGPELRWLVFDAGRVHDAALAERARTDAATASYPKIVLQALSEVGTALVACQTQQIGREALRRAVAAARESLALTQRLYSKGLQDFLAVLDAERTLNDAVMNLASSDQGCGDALIPLHKAPGGGWRAAEGIAADGILDQRFKCCR
jgi:outer membrane protein, multidrug efflux system